MVHRKSEYRLKYKWLPSNLCQAVRVNTADYRHDRKRSDMAHFWSWDGAETNGRCDCEEEDEGERYLPPTVHHQKHKKLLEQWQKSQALQPPERMVPAPSPSRPFTAEYGITRPKENGAHTPDWDLERKVSWKTPGESHHVSPYPSRLDHMSEIPPVPSCAVEQERKPELSDALDFKDYKHSYHPPAPTPHFSVTPYYTRPKSADIRPVMRSPLIPATRPSSAMHAVPHHVSNSTVSEWRRPPFLSYGWADDVKTIGDRKTHNVKAKTKAVYPSALRAWKKKESDIRRQIVTDQQRNLLTKYEHCKCLSAPVNHGSIWMTEYRSNFSRPANG